MFLYSTSSTKKAPSNQVEKPVDLAKLFDRSNV